MSTVDLIDDIDTRLASIVDASGNSTVFAKRAPDDQTGTYAVWHLYSHPRRERLSWLVDIRLDIYSQVSGADAHTLADAIDALLNGWGGTMTDGYLAPLSGGEVQDVPADQSEPLVTRLTCAYTGIWASTDRAISLDATEGVS